MRAYIVHLSTHDENFRHNKSLDTVAPRSDVWGKDERFIHIHHVAHCARRARGTDLIVELTLGAQRHDSSPPR